MVAQNTQTRSIEWSPVIGGTLLACALSLVLVQFGQALGLSFTNLNSDEVVTGNSLLAFGLWLLWVQLSASVVGGYFVGRALVVGDNTPEGELRDGAHGLLVWALSSVLTAIAVGAVAAFAALAAQGVDQDTQVALSDAMAKRITIISGFSVAASSLVSAVAAWIMATIGGDHRDRKIDLSRHIRSRRTKRTA